MNAKLTAMITALGSYAVTLSDAGLEIPEVADAEIDELLDAANEFSLQITDEESDAALLSALTDMLDAIKAELSGKPTEDAVTIPRGEYDILTHDSELLGCLEACGVDNWDGYSDAHEMLREADE